jgi:hypothetical protein
LRQMQQTGREELEQREGSSLEPQPGHSNPRMELDLNPDNVKVHEALLQQMLQILEKEHNDFIMKELLDLNKEPQKSYMSEFEGKVSRALKKHRTRLRLPPVQNQLPDRGPQQEIYAFRLLED